MSNIDKLFNEIESTMTVEQQRDYYKKLYELQCNTSQSQEEEIDRLNKEVNAVDNVLSSMYNDCLKSNDKLQAKLDKVKEIEEKLYHILATIPAFAVIEILDNKKGEV